MNLDIRYPLGMIFLAIGFVLALMGLLTRGSALYATSMGININLIWGGVMLLFGALMVLMAKRVAGKPVPHAAHDPNAPQRPHLH